MERKNGHSRSPCKICTVARLAQRPPRQRTAMKAHAQWTVAEAGRNGAHALHPVAMERKNGHSRSPCKICTVARLAQRPPRQRTAMKAHAQWTVAEAGRNGAHALHLVATERRSGHSRSPCKICTVALPARRPRRQRTATRAHAPSRHTSGRRPRSRSAPVCAHDGLCAPTPGLLCCPLVPELTWANAAATCGPRNAATQVAATVCAGSTPAGGKFTAGGKSCTAAQPAATQVCSLAVAVAVSVAVAHPLA